MIGISTLGVLTLVGASNIDITENATPGIVQFPINRLKSDGLDRRSSETDGLLSETLFNSNFYYAVHCSLGTPAQDLQLILDTGSSDFWVIDSDRAVCGPNKCDTGAKFSSSGSSTFQSNSTKYYQRYADGSFAKGTWAQDTLSMGDATIKNFNFALANVTSSSRAVAGIGLPKGETPYLLGYIDSPYANLPMQLKSSGHIAHVAYSLYLNSHSEATGSIVFGGVDEGAFYGDLYRFPLVPVDTTKIDRLAIKLQSLWVMNDKGEQQKVADTSYPVVLDSGSTMSALPGSLLKPLMESIGAYVYHERGIGLGIVECKHLQNNKGGIGFTFGNVEFVINFRDLITKGSNGICSLGFLESSIPILGDNVLRSLYVVYDLENKEIAIAQANTNSSVQHSYKTIENSIPGKLAPGYNDTKIERTQRLHQVTVFGKHHNHHSESSTLQDSSSDAFSTLTATTAPVEVTVGGTASKAGLVPTHSGGSGSSSSSSSSEGESKNHALHSSVNRLCFIFLGFFSLLLPLL